jgi:hypothetical protein
MLLAQLANCLTEHPQIMSVRVDHEENSRKLRGRQLSAQAYLMYVLTPLETDA